MSKIETICDAFIQGDRKLYINIWGGDFSDKYRKKAFINLGRTGKPSFFQSVGEFVFKYIYMFGIR